MDIETAPNVADVWSLWQLNVSLNQLRESSYVLCWAAKWLDDKEILFDSLWSSGEAMIQTIYRLMDAADAIVTYNGDRFDLPTLNKEFLLSGLTPPAPYKSIDVYKIIKSQFKFPSGKLQYVSKALGLGGKVEHEGHDLWVKVRSGDGAAQLRMKEYCKGDVQLLDSVFKEVRPWARSVPNVLLYDGSNWGCPRCHSTDLERRGYSYTAVSKFQRYRCKSCGGWSQDTKRVEGVEIKGV